MLSLFHQTTFINGVTFFSNEIFTDGKEGNNAEKIARLGTLGMGFCAFSGATTSMFLWSHFKRTTFFKTSLIVMTICLAFSGIFAFLKIQEGLILFTLIFVYTFDCGFGPTLWVYSSDVLDHYGSSIVGVINMFWTWVFATFSNLMFKYFTPPGCYLGLVVINSFSLAFIWKFVRETKGKSREECMTLYKD